MYELLAKIYIKKTWVNILLFAVLDAIGIIAIATVYNMVSLGQSSNSAPNIFVVNNAISPTHYLPRWYETKIRDQTLANKVTSLTTLSVFVDNEVATFSITDRDIYIDLLNVTITTSSETPAASIKKNTVYISRDLEKLAIVQGTKLAINFAGVTGLNNETIEFYITGFIENLNDSECKRCIIATEDVFEDRKDYPNHVVSQILFSTPGKTELSDVSKILDSQFINERYRTKTVPLSQLESRLKITFYSIGESLISLAVVIGLLLVILKFIEVKFIDNIIRSIEQPLCILGSSRHILLTCRLVLVAVQLILPILIIATCLGAVFYYFFWSASMLAPLFKLDAGMFVIIGSMTIIIVLFNFLGIFKYKKHLAAN